MPSDLGIEASGLHKVYQDGPVTVRAVQGIDLKIRRGTLVLLTGPSGGGKTTLLSMLGCILRPSEGEVKILGETVVWRERLLPLMRRRHIGFIFQHFNLLSSLTAAENVAVALRLKGVPKQMNGARELLESVGLGHRWNFMPRDLSGGEKQRVAISRALAGDPSIVLADEPTGELDSKSGRVVIELLRNAAIKENRSIVIVSHDLRIVEFADEVYHLEDGHLEPYRAVEHGPATWGKAEPAAPIAERTV